MSLAVNYRDYWKFSRWPFRDSVPPQTYLQLSGQIEANARLQIVLQRVYPLSVVVGPEGVGKTSFLARNVQPKALMQHRKLAPPIYLSLAGMGPGELFDSISALTFERTMGRSRVCSERIVRDVLKANGLQDLSSLILLDDAHLASSEVALDVFRLLEFVDNLAIVLSTTEIPTNMFRELIQSRAQLRIDLHPWSLSDVEQFIQLSVANAGGNPLLFNDQSIVRLHELSDGVARRLIQLLEITLLAGAASQATIITPELVDSAAEEIGVPQAEVQWGR